MKVKITAPFGYRCKGEMYQFNSVVDIKPEYFNPQVMVKVEEPKPTEKKEETIRILGNLETLGKPFNGGAETIKQGPPIEEATPKPTCDTGGCT